MAQRKTPPSGQSSGNRPAGSKAPAGKAPTGKVSTSKGAGGKTTASKTTGLVKPPVGRPAVRKAPPRKGKSIVNQKQTPWGLIAATAAVVLFAAAIVVVVIVTHKSDNAAAGKCSRQIGNNSTSYLNKNACAMAIKGVTFNPEPKRSHVQGVVKYDSTPPVGGNHSQYWADCTGTVYPQAIANENAVHMLEHGAVWITYNAKTLPPSGLSELKRYVAGQDRMALSPYPNLKTPISLQSWGYQLFVQKASDPRIARFIAALRYNPVTTPEYGATCSDSSFIQHPSTFGHPLWVPAAGGTGGTMP